MCTPMGTHRAPRISARLASLQCGGPSAATSHTVSPFGILMRRLGCLVCPTGRSVSAPLFQPLSPPVCYSAWLSLCRDRSRPVCPPAGSVVCYVRPATFRSRPMPVTPSPRFPFTRRLPICALLTSALSPTLGSPSPRGTPSPERLWRLSEFTLWSRVCFFTVGSFPSRAGRWGWPVAMTVDVVALLEGWWVSSW